MSAITRCKNMRASLLRVRGCNLGPKVAKDILYHVNNFMHDIKKYEQQIYYVHARAFRACVQAYCVRAGVTLAINT